MLDSRRLIMLFTAFAEKDDSKFERLAEEVIYDELTANHHSLARDLKKALELNNRGTFMKPAPQRNEFSLVKILIITT